MQSWNRRWLLLFLLAVVAGTGFVVARRANASTKASKAMTSPFAAEKKLPGPVSGGQKLCSVLWPGHWRDTISMPPAATAPSCTAWEADTAATQYQLGCVFADGSISLGPANGGAPSPNCGW